MRVMLLIFVIVLSMNANKLSFTCFYNKASNMGKIAKDEMTLSFILDPASNEATVVGNNGASKVGTLSSEDGITFIEITPSGSIMSTSILLSDGTTVTSRNIMYNNKMLSSQLYGKCNIGKVNE